MAEQGEHGISWTDRTWNPVVGCTKVSQGCKHCYAKMIHDLRHKAYKAGKKIAPQYAHPFETVQLMPDRLHQPLSWRKPQRVFVNSVSDLFHEDIPDDYIVQVFMVMAEAERHTFQILTKRPERMRRWFTEYLPEACSGELPAPVWPLPNVWLGTSVENQKAADDRIPHLLGTPAAVRFLSCEPLLGPVVLCDQWMRGAFVDCADAVVPEHLQLYAGESACDGCPGYGPECDAVRGSRLDWIIVGGESGPDARQMRAGWARDIRDRCAATGVAFHFKQWGVFGEGGMRAPKRNASRLLDGVLHDGFPAVRP